MAHFDVKNNPSARVDSDKEYAGSILFVICFVLGMVGLTTPNPVETFLGSLILPILFFLLWRPGELPVLLFAATFQFTQVFIPVIVANLAEETLNQDFGEELSWAFYLGSLSVLILAYGMKIGLGKLPVIILFDKQDDLSKLSPTKLATAYFLSLGLSTFIGTVAFNEAGLTQVLLALGSLHWLAVFLIAWVGFRLPKFRFLFLAVTILEIIIGMTGFFSGFKFVLFMILVIYGGTNSRVIRLLRPQVLIILSLIILLTTYWQSIKNDYRGYVNLGGETQTVDVSLSDRLSYHANSISNFNSDNFGDGVTSGLSRLGYIRFFAGSIKTVPSIVPYQGGKLWGEAIFFSLVPRAIYPEKPIADDSVRTNLYSGINVAGADKGTSISIGYVGESYIDFGVPLMFMPILLLGYFWGWLYRFISNCGSIPLLGLAASTTILLQSAISFESSNIKIFAGAVILLLVYSQILKYYSEKFWHWLKT
jgi:hypothetical protein